MKDYYEIMEVHPRASQEIIKKAYLVLSKRYHPDGHDDEKSDWAHERFKQISEAYSVLSNTAKRRSYDLGRSDSEDDYGELDDESIENDEKAYFHHRLGLDYFNKTEKRRFLSVLSGQWQRNIKGAQKHFLEVVRNFSTSYYADQAHYYYLVCLTREYDYSEEHKELVEKEAEFFFKSYPESEWVGPLYYQLGRFYLFKRQDYRRAMEQLERFVAEFPDHSDALEARRLLAHIKRR